MLRKRPGWDAAANSNVEVPMSGPTVCGFSSSNASMAPVVGGELDGTTHNQTDHAMTRVSDEHGPTDFWEPRPAHEISAKGTDTWCVGSHFGIPAMNVTYKLSNGKHVRFEAFFRPVIDGLESSCSISDPTHPGPNYGCATSAANKSCTIIPVVGGQPRGACTARDANFRVFRR
jgi:hypothetical protein